ncbi:hypothetical protein [Helicoverpa armigera nucleopolyhedrovirus]|uniref:8.2 kDa protein n=1 Tax=Helicoverpa armigera nucleopolyhedrovirus TaxID=51313 RepID=Q91BX1_9ABAC|nr:hypothetical protein [Helicoverpa armigera nucleopolyhedrovirus]AAK96383.1 unknown [Helicoverpa armigera nucleopolyhedrovirus]
MYYLDKMIENEYMPAKARQLFRRTFHQYHKLHAGDEDAALKTAYEAVTRHYVKLNNRWIPKTAAAEIVRHDIVDEDDDDDDDDDNINNKNKMNQQRFIDQTARRVKDDNGRRGQLNNYEKTNDNNNNNNIDYRNDEDDDDDDDEENTSGDNVSDEYDSN